MRRITIDWKMVISTFTSQLLAGSWSFPFPNHVKLCFQARPALAGPSILPPYLQLSLTCSHKPFLRAPSEGFAPDGTQSRFLPPWGRSWWRWQNWRQFSTINLVISSRWGRLQREALDLCCWNRYALQGTSKVRPADTKSTHTHTHTEQAFAERRKICVLVSVSLISSFIRRLWHIKIWICSKEKRLW